MSTTPVLTFGSFDWICSQAALVVCPLLGPSTFGIEPICYSRNVQIGNTLIFQPATAFLHIVALLMVTVMIVHIRSKYTAVGRKEIVTFFYLYAAVSLLSIFLDTAIIPASSVVYEWFAAVHTGLITATFWCLLVNGFVGFQFAEDGTPLSLWSLRLSSLLVFFVSGFIAIATFKSIASFSSASPVALWIIEFIFNGACVLIYIILQLILVIRTLDDRWPIGDVIFGVFFFVAGQVILYGFSVTVCEAVQHYIDGLFFATLCILFSVMMVYKYWDSITKEDLEFSVGSKQAVWEVKDALLRNDELDDEMNSRNNSNLNGGTMAGSGSNSGYGSSYGGSSRQTLAGQSYGQTGYPPAGKSNYGY